VVAVLLFGVVALALLAWWTSRITVQRQRRAIADCRQRYAEARSAADSGLVDMVYIESYRPRAAGRRASRTCGDLRLAGRLTQDASR
jgi:type II secretory pathway pseudopilin PulG